MQSTLCMKEVYIPISFMLVSHGELQLGQFVGKVKTFNKTNQKHTTKIITTRG